ncbi:alpha-2-macroglobulin (plasmid) [Azospirillum sp. TSH58]|uniref:alpha-2-macroglobulin family protein n=1 Tax=Azospirillum sp. TSH58 TaxID=664962 RepID=UPI000D5FE8D2|nr:alpha-2-macroglobulin [Azospirillum sp. TSH58]AWJ87218.1 alpha-2-macroglobulin [Azospirillum sp. TSH58]PWC72819.1 alpha-2-macroglobulin [Azospirillum sp. TSH58]
MLRAVARVCAVLVASSTPVIAADAPPEPVPFGVSSAEVVAERDVPQACFTFTDRLEKSRAVNYRDYVEVTPAGGGAAGGGAPFDGTAVARDRTLCVEGLKHGQSYRITLRDGLPGSDGKRLPNPDARDIEVPNRKPALAFRGAGYILPRIGADGLPLRSINLDRAKLQVLRINDRSLVEKIYFGRIGQQMSDHEVGEILDRSGQEVWRGEMAISNSRNQAVVTPFPIDAVLGRLEPGVYIAVASTEDIKPGGWDHKATQWFVVSDLGLNAITGEDALVVFARSVKGATPEAGVELRLLARNNEELGKALTGADGLARFDLAALRAAGREPVQALFAYRGAGDFGFLDLVTPTLANAPPPAGAPNAAPGGVAAVVPARPVPGQPDAFLYTERGIYRPGETVHLAALLRDADAKPVTGRPVTLKIQRPDGFEVDRRPLSESGGGSFAARVEIPANAMTGTWAVTVHGEPEAGSQPNAMGPVLGRAEFLVEDFVPPRLEVALAAEAAELPADGKTTLTVDGHFLYGAPAAGLPGELAVTLRAAANPYPNLPGYRFGLAQEEVKPLRTDLPGFTTNRNGQAKADLALPKAPESTKPLEAVVRATLLDIGGRSVSRDLVLPVRHQPYAVGIRPRFEGDGVPEGATAGFDVVAVGPDGQPMDKEDLSYELFEEEYDYAWFEANGRWDYKVTVRDQRVTGGTLAAQAAKPGSVEAPVTAGRYRLEVFDPKTGVASSLRFAAGWWMTPTAGERPDQVDVTVMLPAYKGGETAWVYVKPPYDSEVLIAVADRKIRQASTRRIGPEGAFLEIPVDPTWTGGVYVLATAFGAPDAAGGPSKGVARRAVGLSWLAVDGDERALDVRVAAPAQTEPRRSVTAEVVVEGAPEGQPAYVTVAAVDDAVLQLTDQHSPNPIDHYLGKRRLGVELRDSFGRLIDPAVLDATRTRPGAAPRLRQVGVTVPQKSERVVALFSGVLTVGPEGKVAVPLDVPDFQGRLRLMAVAWSGDKLGRSESSMLVADPVLADLGLPRFLAPGDRAVIPVTLDNVAGPAGAYNISLIASGAVSLSEGTIAVPELGKGKRATAGRVLTANGVGTGHIALDVTGPDGLRITRQWEIPVRPASPLVTRRTASMLAPERSVELPADLLNGLRPETATAALSLGNLPDLDVPGLLTALERGGPGGLEMTASRALPLLSLGDVAVALGVASDERVKARVQRSVDRALTFQRMDGAFAAWSPKGEADSWLTAYALDFLGRAKAAGYRVPEGPYRKGLDGLRGALDNAWVEADEQPARAYALYVLARAKMIDAGAVRYFQETFWDKLQTDFARAQVATAIAALGDKDRAAEAFGRLSGARVVSASLRDYGSSLRDEAGVVALMAESGVVERERLTQATERLSKTYAAVRTTGVQEQAWLLQAARALIDRAPPMKIAQKDQQGADQVAEGVKPLFQRIDPAAPPAIRNAGGEPLRQILSVSGIADAAPGAEEQGMTVTRSLFDMTGRPADPGAVRPNDRLVVILEGSASDPVDRQVLVSDPLPAGFEIEAARFAGGGAPLGDLSWLGELTAPRAVDYRDDRFVAALDMTKQAPRFRLVYLVRAVTPGDYAQPGAVVEDLYRPHQSARTAASRLRVLPE